MKILHVCSNYYPAHGGPQYTVKHLSEKLVEYYNDTVDVATTDSLYGPELKVFEPISPSYEEINKVNVHRFAFNRWHYRVLELSGRIYKRLFKRMLPYNIRKYRWELDCNGILTMMQKSDSDVIMATTIAYMFGNYPLWRFKTKKPKPFILYGALHLNINWPGDSPVIKRARACDCYIANTEFERKKLIEYGVSESKIVTIGTGINPDEYNCDDDAINSFREKYSISKEDILIGHIGRLSEGKGAGILLDAFIQLHRRYKNVKLLLAGTYTDYVERLKQKISQHKLPVILLNDFDENVKPVLFNSLDIFVLASGGESLGVVFLEAWACKKPVIGMNLGAIASLISENVDGLLFEKGNSLDLVEKISQLINDKQIRIEFGKKGFEKIMCKYTWPVIVEQYRSAYQLAIENFKNQRYPE